MMQTYTLAFNPQTEGGYTVTCPGLSGLATYGESLDEACVMGRDAMEGLIEVMLERRNVRPRVTGWRSFRDSIDQLTLCGMKAMRSRSSNN